MLEAFIGFLIGYIFKGLLTPPREFEVLLCWDQDSFGWRPVGSKDQVVPGKRYLAAIELNPESFVPEPE